MIDRKVGVERLSGNAELLLVVFALVVSPITVVAQEEHVDEGASATRENDVELLDVIIDHSRANLGQIQTWHGRATVRIERTIEGPAGGTEVETASGTITFVYDLNTGKIKSDWVLDENSPDPDKWHPRHPGRRYDHFNPVCWQFPMKQNIIGSSFGRFGRSLKEQLPLPKGQILQEGSVVRLWIGASEDNCNVYEIDLDKGASLVAYQTLGRGRLVSSWTLEPQLVDGVWIASRTCQILTDATRGFKEIETIEWFENEIKHYGE